MDNWKGQNLVLVQFLVTNPIHFASKLNLQVRSNATKPRNKPTVNSNGVTNSNKGNNKASLTDLWAEEVGEGGAKIRTEAELMRGANQKQGIEVLLSR